MNKYWLYISCFGFITGAVADEGSRETPKVLPQMEDTTPAMIGIDDDEAMSSEIPGSYLVPD